MSVARRSPIMRVLGWFWRRRELAQLKQFRRQQRGITGQLEERANLLSECGERAQVRSAVEAATLRRLSEVLAPPKLEARVESPSA